MAAAVLAAVVAAEAEVRRWFSWHWYLTDTLIADLIRAGRLYRVDAYLAARPSQAGRLRPAGKADRAQV